MRRMVLRLILLLILTALGLPAPANAGCGCEKPPPPRGPIRPGFGWRDSQITIYGAYGTSARSYDVWFYPDAGAADMSRGRSIKRRDLADGRIRTQLRARVPNLAYGPCRIVVLRDGKKVQEISDSQFTVIAPPLALHDVGETITRDGYTTGIGRDRRIYVALDVSEVSDGTSFTGFAVGWAVGFGSTGVTMYNMQGVTMQVLDPTMPGLFRIRRTSASDSTILDYWRHEFQSYKQRHRQQDGLNNDADPDWHADGTRHFDHDTVVVAVNGTVAGRPLTPGSTPPFRLQITSVPAPQSPLP